VTGLTTTPGRRLSEAGWEFSIATDEVKSSVEKFTYQLGEARKFSGSLFDEIKGIDGALAVNIASTRSSSEAIDLLASAWNKASDATQKAQIAQAAFGKGGAAKGPILGAIDNAGGIDAYSASVQKANGLT